ncbi:hypothetical protein BG004_002342, partial [Podila humilis]
TLSKFQDRADFSLTIMPSSINYLHREKFRSDVLVTFHEPIVLTPQLDAKLFSSVKEERMEAINKLTELLENNLYAGDLGTRISLGQYVRLTRKFVAAFSTHHQEQSTKKKVGKLEGIDEQQQQQQQQEEDEENGNMSSESESLARESKFFGMNGSDPETIAVHIDNLAKDLAFYQDQLDFYHLKDYRIKQGKPSSKVLVGKLFQRFLWACVLSAICIPGLVLWAPVFIAVRYKEKQIRQKGPLEDNLDEIAQYKLMISTFFLPLIWGFWVLMTLPIAMVSGPGIVVLMWLTIRWLEDLIHNAKSMLSLLRLLFMSEETMLGLRDKREELASRVHEYAVEQLGLPDDIEELVKENRTRKANVGWLGKLSGSYFSIKRRRRKDWNEVMRLHDVSNYDR